MSVKDRSGTHREQVLGATMAIEKESGTGVPAESSPSQHLLLSLESYSRESHFEGTNRVGLTVEERDPSFRSMRGHLSFTTREGDESFDTV
jgi:hypothetical protein